MTPSIATNAYAQIAKLTAPSALPGVGPGKTPEANFGDMLKQSLEKIVETGRNSDQKSADMMVGKANLLDVVTAVAETESAIETLVSVRDKVIQSYEEILRMQI